MSPGGLMRIRRVVAIVLSFTSTVLAQQNAGSISGTVSDPSDAAVSGAKITMTNELTGLSRTTSTAGDGSYSVLQLAVGIYRVEAEGKGFAKTSRSRGAFGTNPKGRLALSLKGESIQQIVEVV